MRNAFIEELVSLAAVNPRIVLLVGDLGYSVIEPFADLYPDRFVNVGVAEQNMAGLAAGMASEGCHVFIYSIANFPTFRCAEQIRNDIDYHNLPVTVVSVGGGVAYGNLGYSHHAVQDYALMRSFPNMLIAAPGDPMEVRACLHYLVANSRPSYLRLGKTGEPCFHANIPSISPGSWLKVAEARRRSSKNAALLSTGAALEVAMGWWKSDFYECYSVYSMPLWGMAQKKSQILIAENYDFIETVEDHLIDGGFGSWMLEAFMGRSDVLSRFKVNALGSQVCGAVGAQKMLHEFGGLRLGM